MGVSSVLETWIQRDKIVKVKSHLEQLRFYSPPPFPVADSTGAQAHTHLPAPRHGTPSTPPHPWPLG